MKPRYNHSWKVVLAFTLLSSLWSGAVRAGVEASPPIPLQPTVGTAVQADLSPALRDMPPIPPEHVSGDRPPANFRLPKPWKAEPKAQDPVLQVEHGALAMPAPIYSFDGVSNVNSVHPPDTQGDVGYDPATGAKYYVQWVNLSFAIWDVTGTPTQIYGPVNGNTLWQGFGGPCETSNHGDPITLFDTMSNRWLMSQFSINGPYYQCIAISQTSDPTGAWHRYAFLVSSNKMNDYPHFGVWPDGYYMTVNQFTNGVSWGGAGVFVFDRAKMLVGDPTATFQYFDLYSVNPNFGGMLPSDLDGRDLPPAGAPNYFLEVDNSPDELSLWEFHVDWANPANTTFGINGQPNATLPVAAWSELCSSTRSCIPQPGTSVGLDGIGDRLMYRVAYRNLRTHESLVLNHTVNAGGGLAGVRWYELRDPGGTPTIHQQGTHAPDSDHRWMGSIAMDAVGNVALGYSVSSSSLYPSVRYAGRLVGDPLGTLAQAEVTMVAGSGSQTSSYNRWGDYSMMGIDPVDDCTFWYTQEYIETTGYANWKTRIGAFRFPSCTMAQPGTILGTVSDAGAGSPVAGAVVEASAGQVGPEATVTDQDGTYALLLEAGAYTVTASAYGYLSHAETNVVVFEGMTITVDIDLTPAPHHVVSGTVSDAETGWPLYARVLMHGDPFDPPAPDNGVWTDPVTGFYSFTLPADITYTLEADAWVEGYTPASAVVGPLTGNTVRNFALNPNWVTCNAPGYDVTRIATYETGFDGGVLPTGWSVVDSMGTGAVWRFDDPKDRGNQTGGSGAFAIIDSDYAGATGVDTELGSPALDLSALATVILEFKHDFRWYLYGQDEVADVDVSTNSGGTWQNVWRRTGSSDRGPKTIRTDISAIAAGEPDVRVRFRYYNARYEWWWQVDDVFIGAIECVPTAGGLIVGEVRDANTDAPVAAQVTHDAAYTVTAVPLDVPGSGAFYTLFAPAGSRTITATASGYGPVVMSRTVVQSDTVRQDIALPAGILGWVTSDTLDITLLANVVATRHFTLTNSGGFTVDFEVQGINAPVPPDTTGPFAVPVRRVSPKHLHDRDALTVRSYDPPAVPTLQAGTVLRSWETGLAAPWGIVVAPDSGSVWVNDTRWGGGSERVYRFLPDGTPTGDAADIFSSAAVFAADMAYNPVTGAIWQVNVGGDNCIYELDAATLSATGRTVCPTFGVSQRGLAYDPATGTFYSGSWNDQNLYHFDASGQMLDSQDIGLNIAGLACHPVSGRLFVLSNAAIGHDVYVLDSRNGYAVLGGFDIEGLGGFEQAGLVLDADGHLWTVNQTTGVVIQATSGELAALWDEISWLSVAPVTGTVAVGVEQAITLTFDTAGMEEGTYPVHLRVNNNAPYGDLKAPITLTVVYQNNVALAPGMVEQNGDPGSDVLYTLQVSNTGQVTDLFTVTLEGDGWLAVAPLTVGPLASGEATPLPISVTVPSGAACGAGDDITVTVTSHGNPNRTARAFLRTTANPVYGVQADVWPAVLIGDPGDVLSASVYVSNTGNCVGWFEASAMGQWPVSLPDPMVQVPAGDERFVVANVRVPSAAMAGDMDVATLIVTVLEDTAQQATVALTTTANAVYGADLLPVTDRESGPLGATVVYTLGLTNAGNIVDSYNLVLDGATWTTTLAPKAVALEPGETAPVVVTVTVPPDVVSATADVARVTATGTGVTAYSDLTTTAVLSHGVALDAAMMSGEALVGETVTYTVWVTNTGGYTDTFDVIYADNTWPVSLLWNSVELGSQVGMVLRVRVTVPEGASVGESDTLLLTATSQGDAVASASLVLTTTAVDCVAVRGATFTYTPMPVIAGRVITFTGTSASGTAVLPITYTWDFNGLEQTGNPITHTFPVAAPVQTYTVTLEVSNACQSQDTVKQVVTVYSYVVYLPIVVRNVSFQ